VLQLTLSKVELAQAPQMAKDDVGGQAQLPVGQEA